MGAAWSPCTTRVNVLPGWEDHAASTFYTLHPKLNLQSILRGVGRPALVAAGPYGAPQVLPAPGGVPNLQKLKNIFAMQSTGKNEWPATSASDGNSRPLRRLQGMCAGGNAEPSQSRGSWGFKDSTRKLRRHQDAGCGQEAGGAGGCCHLKGVALLALVWRGAGSAHGPHSLHVLERFQRIQPTLQRDMDSFGRSLSHKTMQPASTCAVHRRRKSDSTITIEDYTRTRAAKTPFMCKHYHTRAEAAGREESAQKCPCEVQQGMKVLRR